MTAVKNKTDLENRHIVQTGLQGERASTELAPYEFELAPITFCKLSTD